MKRLQTYNIQLNVKISDTINKGLEELALSKGMGKSECVRFLIQTAIEDHKKK